MEEPDKKSTRLTRRGFFGIGAVGAASLGTPQLWAQPGGGDALTEATAGLEYLTIDRDFINYGRGKPPPHQLPLEKRQAVGLVPETWQLEVLADPDSNAKVDKPLSKASGNALNWDDLMRLAEKHAVRFMSVMSCTNGRKPCGMGLWEGVPLREVIWRTRPQANVRRVFYDGYHNDDPKQRFQSSLPIGRVLEDPPGEHPVILCYKLNDQWLTSKRGAPVRMIVPGAYGNKSVKWLQRIFLTNTPQANDTYAEWNNDTESAIKTCARFLQVPKKVRSGRPIAITGVAQVGMSGLNGVQYWLRRADKSLPEDDPHLTRGQWKEARILPPPTHWGGGLPDGKLPPVPRQINPQTGRPYQWPMRDAIAHWTVSLEGLGPGDYKLCCRTIDANGVAQPMPRPFPKSGHNAIQTVGLIVT